MILVSWDRSLMPLVDDRFRLTTVTNSEQALLSVVILIPRAAQRLYPLPP